MSRTLCDRVVGGYATPVDGVDFCEGEAVRFYNFSCIIDRRSGEGHTFAVCEDHCQAFAKEITYDEYVVALLMES